MACNCNEGNRYNINFGCCVPTLAPADQYYTKSQVDKLIEGIEVSGVTEEEVDEKIASAMTEIEAEIPTVPTDVSAFNNDVPYLTEHQSLDGYVTDEEMAVYTYDKETIDTKIVQASSMKSYVDENGILHLR